MTNAYIERHLSRYRLYNVFDIIVIIIDCPVPDNPTEDIDSHTMYRVSHIKHIDTKTIPVLSKII